MTDSDDQNKPCTNSLQWFVAWFYFIACSHFTLADYNTIRIPLHFFNVCNLSPRPSSHDSCVNRTQVWERPTPNLNSHRAPSSQEGDTSWWPPPYLDCFHSSTTLSHQTWYTQRRGYTHLHMASQLGTVPLGSQRALSLLFPDKKLMLVCMCEAKVQWETFSVKGMSVLKTWFGSRLDKDDRSLWTASLFSFWPCEEPGRWGGKRVSQKVLWS